jgi:peptide/nickel transport system ATP-binding protein
VTLSLVLGAAFLWVVGGLIVGVVAAATRGGITDRVLMMLSLIGVSMPVFWVGEVANLVTQSRYHDTWLFSWVPGARATSPLTEDPIGWFKTLVIPWITLAILYIGLYGRILRADLIEVMQEDFIRTARAKGLSERRILLRHGLRSSLVAFVTMFGLDFGALVGGSALLTEVVFGLQGRRQAHLRRLAEPRPAGHPRHRALCLVLRRRRQCDRGRDLCLPRPAHPRCPLNRSPAPGDARLCVSFRTERGVVQAVDDVSFSVRAGEVVGLVGESGSGKTQTLLAIMGLIEDPNATVTGSIRFKGREMLGRSRREWRQVRGGAIAMIFQDPMTALTPVHTIGAQIAEQIRAHEPVSRRTAQSRAIELIASVGIPRPDEAVHRYPHQLSGGMRQRAVIAMALSCSPALLVADEPTTALDVTVQAQILDLLGRLRDDFGSAIILVSHDLGVVAELADRVAVMYAGRLIEKGTAEGIFEAPRHPYTHGLFNSIPPLDGPRPARLQSIPGSPPPLHARPEGCVFRTRCRFAFARCIEPPALTPDGDHLAACFLDPAVKDRFRRHAGDRRQLVS